MYVVFVIGGGIMMILEECRLCVLASVTIGSQIISDIKIT